MAAQFSGTPRAASEFPIRCGPNCFTTARQTTSLSGLLSRPPLSLYAQTIKTTTYMTKTTSMTLHIKSMPTNGFTPTGAIDLTVNIDIEEILKLIAAMRPPQEVTEDMGISAYMDERNAQFARYVGRERSKSSWRKYQTVARHLSAFIRHKYAREDYPVRSVDRAFVRAFTAYLSEHCRLSHGTVRLYLTALRHHTSAARRQGLLPGDPFEAVRLPPPGQRHESLTAQELTRLAALKLTGTALLVRDLFLLSCYTGLAYTDLRHLRPEHVERQGRKGWLTKEREKSGKRTIVRLLPEAMKLLDSLPRRTDGGGWISVPMNRTCNRHLHRLEQRIGLRKQLHFHLARHTFATLLITAGVPIETVSIMLGHSRITTTQIYAQVTRNKIARDTSGMSRAFCLAEY